MQSKDFRIVDFIESGHTSRICKGYHLVIFV